MDYSWYLDTVGNLWVTRVEDPPSKGCKFLMTTTTSQDDTTCINILMMCYPHFQKAIECKEEAYKIVNSGFPAIYDKKDSKWI